MGVPITGGRKPSPTNPHPAGPAQALPHPNPAARCAHASLQLLLAAPAVLCCAMPVSAREGRVRRGIRVVPVQVSAAACDALKDDNTTPSKWRCENLPAYATTCFWDDSAGACSPIPARHCEDRGVNQCGGVVTAEPTAAPTSPVLCADGTRLCCFEPAIPGIPTVFKHHLGW